MSSRPPWVRAAGEASASYTVTGTPFRCRTRASTRPPRPAPTMVTGVVMGRLRVLDRQLDYRSNNASTALERRSKAGMMEAMATTAHRSPRRTQALSREVIVQAAVDLLDAE